jgi:hypothetical protein
MSGLGKRMGMGKKIKPSKKRKPFFGEELVVVNIGIKPFYEDLKSQNVRIVHVDWEPPAGGDEEMVALLDKIL